MPHPYDPYIPSEDDLEYMKKVRENLKKKKGKSKIQAKGKKVNKFSGKVKEINNA